MFIHISYLYLLYLSHQLSRLEPAKQLSPNAVDMVVSARGSASVHRVEDVPRDFFERHGKDFLRARYRYLAFGDPLGQCGGCLAALLYVIPEQEPLNGDAGAYDVKPVLQVGRIRVVVD